MADFVGTDASETVNGTIFPINTDDNLFGLGGDDTLKLSAATTCSRAAAALTC